MKLSVKKLAELIGETRRLRTGGLRVDVVVRDVREVFGRVDCLVTPVAGSGGQWVAFDRLDSLATAQEVQR